MRRTLTTEGEMVIRLVRDDGEVPAHPPARVLLVAEEVLIEALLGALVELVEYEPCFRGPGEAVAEAMGRLTPAIVLLDVRHGAALDDGIHERAASAGAAVRLFGHRSDRSRLASVALRRGSRSIEIPADYRELERFLDEALVPGAEERGEA